MEYVWYCFRDAFVFSVLLLCGEGNIKVPLYIVVDT